jgi:DNA-directed RNA polymerase specialized sigma24 family protein
MGSAIKTRLLGSQSDEKLLELAQLGSRAAFEALVNRHRRLLLRHCRQLCLSEERAQEALQRTLSEAWSGLGSEPQSEELRPWLHRIAGRMVADAMSAQGSSTAVGCVSPDVEAAFGLRRAQPAGDPSPAEVLALRGALAAIAPVRGRGEVLVHRTDGNKTEILVEDAFEIADSAVRGLVRRVRRGISALTPPPLLAWAMGRVAQDSGGGGERIAELGAGGTAGLTGLAVKGGIAALSAGVAITGAVVAQSGHSRDFAAPHHSAPAATRIAAAQATPPARAATVGAPGGRVSSGTASRRHAVDLQRSLALRRTSGTHASRSTSTRTSSTAPASGAKPAAGGAPAGSHVAVAETQSAGQQSSTTSASQSSSASQPSGSGGSTESTTSSSSSSGGGGQTSEATSGSSSEGGGIGVQVSVETGAGKTSVGVGSSGGSSSGGSQSQGTGVGISVGLGPLGSVGVHVSLP